MTNIKFSQVLFGCLLILMFMRFGIGAEKTYDCEYRHYSDTDGHHRVDGDFKLKFTVDRARDEGYMTGNNGRFKVGVIRQPDAITFVEITGTGNVMTTTVDQKNQSVHSRNTVLFGKLLASQYYGSCWSFERVE